MTYHATMKDRTMLRPITISLMLVTCLSLVDAADVHPATVEALAAGNAALEKADGDPSQNLAAALAYSRVLPAYEAAGDLETAAELRATIFWCKKRMNLETLQQFIASKGEDGEVMRAALAKVEQPVPIGEAKAYLDRADAFAQKNAGQSLKIAIRYFEVADRFQGTPESLKAQRLSLEALQQSMVSRRTSDPTLAADLRADAITAGDLPEAAQKLIDQSNQVVDALASKASQDLAQDRRKAVDIVLKEAETAQRRGDLDPMIAHQTQAANIDRDISGLSKSATAAVDAYRKARAKNVAKANGDIAAERKRLTQSLTQVQKEETKRGNTAGALAIKQIVEAIDKAVQGNAADPANKPAPPANANSLAVIVLSGHEVDDLKNGVLSNSNRNYQWLEVPKELTGMRFIRHAGGSSNPINAEVKVAGLVYIGSMSDSEDPANTYLIREGWKKVNLSFSRTNHKGFRVNIYARSVGAGPLVIAAEPFGWAGPILIGSLTNK